MVIVTTTYQFLGSNMKEDNKSLLIEKDEERWLRFCLAAPLSMAHYKVGQQHSTGFFQELHLIVFLFILSIDFLKTLKYKPYKISFREKLNSQ